MEMEAPFDGLLAMTKMNSGEVIINKVRIIPLRTNPAGTFVLF